MSEKKEETKKSEEKPKEVKGSVEERLASLEARVDLLEKPLSQR